MLSLFCVRVFLLPAWLYIRGYLPGTALLRAEASLVIVRHINHQGAFKWEKTWLTRQVVFINSPPAPLFKACPPNPLLSQDWKWLDLWVLKLRLFFSEKSGWQKAVKTKIVFSQVTTSHQNLPFISNIFSQVCVLFWGPAFLIILRSTPTSILFILFY